ncbi:MULTISPECIES: dephospho-CoA kinase [Clostridium]|uniref:Dephospho-CoA kinase n=1 Tax=Clostridium senegalense TaxID=1465809 RepID=A0A6M0H076_9CLOT|nr:MULTISPECIES: dephospho-CoA kinase [Clostridium]NEU04200.1 dephospho-CoA kinase [Clostridium senegalense]
MTQSNTIVVGLTGGIGSGKSTISKMIMEQDISIIDADKISREVLNIYPEILLKIKNEFGEEYFYEDGSLNRKKLGQYVFSSEILKKTLENIIIPYIKREIFDKIKKCRENMEEIAIVDAPTLIENNLQIYMDYVILVMVDEKTQILRVIKRDLQSKEEVLKRIRNQLSLEEKIQYADYVIDNSKDLDFTKSQLAHILNDILLRGKNEKI